MRSINQTLAGLMALALAGMFAGCGGGAGTSPQGELHTPKPDPAARGAMSHLGNEGPVTFDLMAGQHHIAGTVTVTNDGDNLIVKYQTVDPWRLFKLHLYVGTSAPAKSAPGQFPYHSPSLNGVSEYTFTVPIPAGSHCGDGLILAAHAEVKKRATNGSFFGGETGWAAGDCGSFKTGWGSMMCYELAPFCPLPEGDVQAVVAHPGPNSYFLTTLTGVPGGFSVESGHQYVGWCVDLFHNITPGTTYTAHLYSTVGANLPEDMQDDDWDMVNYILNHKQGTRDDIQNAIWFFIGGGAFPSDPDAQAMIADAQANGEGFVPGPGQVTAIIVDAGNATQITILETECDC